MNYLKGEIKRLETAHKYYLKMKEAKKEEDKAYFLNGLNLILTQGETVDNFYDVLREYNIALERKQEVTRKLYEEIKIVKKLKI